MQSIYTELLTSYKQRISGHDIDISHLENFSEQELDNMLTRDNDCLFLKGKFKKIGDGVLPKFEFDGDIDCKVEKFGTIAVLAARKGFHRLLVAALSAGCDPHKGFGFFKISLGFGNYQSSYENPTPLQWLCNNGDVARVKIMMKYVEKFSDAELSDAASILNSLNNCSFPHYGNVYVFLDNIISNRSDLESKRRLLDFFRTKDFEYSGLTESEKVLVVVRNPQLRRYWDTPRFWKSLSFSSWTALFPYYNAQFLKYFDPSKMSPKETSGSLLFLYVRAGRCAGKTEMPTPNPD